MSTLGTVVIYNLKKEEIAKLEATESGHENFKAVASKKLPALVVGESEDGLNLRVFADGHADNDFYKSGVPEGTKAGTYSIPE